jgi:hypothetical protein
MKRQIYFIGVIILFFLFGCQTPPPGDCQLVMSFLGADYCPNSGCPPGQTCVTTATRPYFLGGRQATACQCVTLPSGTTGVSPGTTGSTGTTGGTGPITGTTEAGDPNSPCFYYEYYDENGNFVSSGCKRNKCNPPAKCERIEGRKACRCVAGG